VRVEARSKDVDRKPSEAGWLLTLGTGLAVQGAGAETGSGRRLLGKRAPAASLGGRRVPRASIYLDDGGLVIQFTRARKEDGAPVAFLISSDTPNRPLRLRPKWSEDHRMWTTRIENPPQDYIIAVVPSPQPPSESIPSR